MDTTKRLVWAIGLASVLVAGCAENRYREEENFGDAVRAAKARQIVNPDAGRSAPAPDGIDGTAAKATMDRYQKSFESPPPPANVFTIGVGGQSGGTSTR